MGLKKGDYIPDFSSADLKGKKAMVIYFYPKDNTLGCTVEACSFRDSYEDFIELGAEVIGISTDSAENHNKFAKRHQLPFILLSDTEKKVRRLFKVSGNLFNLLPGRETYVADRDGQIVLVFII